MLHPPMHRSCRLDWHLAGLDRSEGKLKSWIRHAVRASTATDCPNQRDRRRRNDIPRPCPQGHGSEKRSLEKLLSDCGNGEDAEQRGDDHGGFPK